MIDKDKNVRVNITLSKEACKMLDEICKKEFRTRSNYLEMLIRKSYEEK